MTIALIIAVATLTALLPYAWRALDEYRMRRKALAMIRARLPGLRSIPLSRADKRGFETGPDGWIRPR
jgi:hypothetical protein